jgi:hypothetical protein
MSYTNTVISNSHAHSITGGVVKEKIGKYLEDYPTIHIYLLKNGEKGSKLTNGNKLICEFMSLGIEEGDSVEIDVDLENHLDIETIVGTEITKVLETFDTKAYVAEKNMEVREKHVAFLGRLEAQLGGK